MSEGEITSISSIQEQPQANQQQNDERIDSKHCHDDSHMKKVEINIHLKVILINYIYSNLLITFKSSTELSDNKANTNAQEESKPHSSNTERDYYLRENETSKVIENTKHGAKNRLRTITAKHVK